MEIDQDHIDQDPIDQDPKLTTWFSSIEARPATRSIYSIFIRLYCECMKKTPTQLIDDAIKEIKEGKMPGERKETEYLAKYKDCMKAKGYADKSFALGMAAVKSFYKNYDIILPNRASRTKRANPKRDNSNFITKTDIQKLLINTKNLREKAVILMVATSGMAVQEIVKRRIGDISIDSEGIGTISVRRNKTDVDYVTFISPEAVQALKNYWDERDRDPDVTVKVHDERGNLKLDEPVFINYGNRHKGGEMNKLVMCKNFRILGEELGYSGTENGGKGGRKGLVKTRIHVIRKSFSSTLADNGFPKDKIDFMMGHKVPDTDKAYFFRNPDKLKELYKTYLPYLSFEKEIQVHTLDEKRLEELENENDKLKREVESMKASMEALVKETIDKRVSEKLNMESLVREMIDRRVSEKLKFEGGKA